MIRLKLSVKHCKRGAEKQEKKENAGSSDEEERMEKRGNEVMEEGVLKGRRDGLPHFTAALVLARFLLSIHSLEQCLRFDSLSSFLIQSDNGLLLKEYR